VYKEGAPSIEEQNERQEQFEARELPQHGETQFVAAAERDTPKRCV
jgi:hypothetical protein